MLYRARTLFYFKTLIWNALSIIICVSTGEDHDEDADDNDGIQKKTKRVTICLVF